MKTPDNRMAKVDPRIEQGRDDVRLPSPPPITDIERRCSRCGHAFLPRVSRTRGGDAVEVRCPRCGETYRATRASLREARPGDLMRHRAGIGS